MSIYSAIEDHRAMIFDLVRNTAYAKAIKAAVTPGCTVLDLGAGLGIHGLLAAAAGAKKVILLEPSPVAELGLEIARKNGLSERIEVIRKRIEDIESLEAVDLIVSVFTGNFLLSEDLLPLLFSARDRFLKPGGLMIPGRARMKAALVQAQDYYDEHVGRWSQPILDLNFSVARRCAANTMYYGGASSFSAEALSLPITLLELDFTSAQVAECRCKVAIPVKTSGTCHGILGWFEMQLGDEWLSTGPEAEPMHWSLAFLPFDPPLEFHCDETVEFELDRPEFGEWTWTVTQGGVRQRHSTFQSNPLDLNVLKKQSTDHAPGLGAKGELALSVLSQIAQGKTVAQVISQVREQFSKLTVNDRQLEKRIRGMVAEWGADVD